MINKTDISKFSLAEALSNSNGKTSGSKLGGLYTTFIGGIGLFVSIILSITKSTDAVAIAGICAGVITAGLTTLGYSKKKETKDTTNTEEIK